MAAILLLMPNIVGGQTSPDVALEEALVALQEGNFSHAGTLLEATVEKWPGYWQAHYHLGRLAFDRGDLDAAANYLDFASEGHFPKVFSAQYYLGRTLNLQRQFAEALEAFDAALERAPSFAPALMERGRTHLFLGKQEAGLADLLQSLESADPPRQALNLTAQYLILRGRFAEAKALEERLIDWTRAEGRWGQRARWRQLAMNPGPAVQAELAGLVEEYPEVGDLYWAMGMVHLEDDPARAATLFRTALDHDSENPVSLLALEQLEGAEGSVTQPVALPSLRAMLNRSLRLWEEDRYDEAREVAESLLEVRPRLVPARLLLASDAVRRGGLWQAAALYEELLDGLGAVPSVGQRLAEAALGMNAPELALCGAELALQGSPNDASLYYLLGVIEADRGNTDAAIRAHKRALELGSEDVRIWLLLGDLYFEQMSISESIAAYAKAVDLEPAAAESVRPFALSSLTTEQYSSLRHVLEVLIQQHPENNDILYSLGVMSLRDNELDSAKEYFLRLAEVVPDHHQVHYNLGQILLRQGESSAGLVEMEKFRQIKAAEDEEWEAHNQAHFRRVEARRLVADGRPGEAVPLYTQSVTEGTAELMDYLELAGANLESGRVAEALLGYEGILSTYPYQNQALEGLRLAAIQLGDLDRAAAAVVKLEIRDWPCKMNRSQKGGDS